MNGDLMVAGEEPSPVCDFVGGALGRRLRGGVGRGEPLARAVGVRPGRLPAVVDATAGLGRDAALLAAIGLSVTLIERNPAMQEALARGLAAAAAAAAPFPAIAARMTLVAGDARDHLKRLRPAVVFIDPMHPPRRKSALVRKPLRQVRATVGSDPDAAELLACALQAATERVVLKWPLRGPPLPGAPPPHHTLSGKTVRYDVFLSRATAAG